LQNGNVFTARGFTTPTGTKSIGGAVEIQAGTIVSHLPTIFASASTPTNLNDQPLTNYDTTGLTPAFSVTIGTIATTPITATNGLNVLSGSNAAIFIQGASAFENVTLDSIIINSTTALGSETRVDAPDDVIVDTGEDEEECGLAVKTEGSLRAAAF
jgi:hypothetical protein